MSSENRSPESRQHRKYICDTINHALEEIENGKSFREVATTFNIPVGSLYRFKNNPSLRIGTGRKQLLNDDEEALLVEAITVAEKANQPIDRDDVKKWSKNT